MNYCAMRIGSNVIGRMHGMVAKAGLAMSTNPRLKAGVIRR
jgi:hypothetical protein